jgi:hypothetical protein
MRIVFAFDEDEFLPVEWAGDRARPIYGLLRVYPARYRLRFCTGA